MMKNITLTRSQLEEWAARSAVATSTDSLQRSCIRRYLTLSTRSSQDSTTVKAPMSVVEK